MITDTTFFTNEPGYALLDRFKKTLKHVKYFDVLVGYFRSSGFHQLCESFESIDKIRILVGLNIDQKAYEIIESVRPRGELDFESHSRTKRIFSEQAALHSQRRQREKDGASRLSQWNFYLPAPPAR